MSGITIGYHDKGLFDWADAVKTDKKVASGLSPSQAAKFAEKHDGAELLVRTSGKDENAKFDVYTLTVGDNKSLTDLEIIDHVSFVDDLAEKVGGQSVTIASDSIPYRNGEKYTYFGHIQSEGKYNGIMHANERIEADMTYSN